MFSGLGVQTRGYLVDLVVGFTPQGVDVGVFGADRDGGIGRAAKVDRDVRLLNAALWGGGAGKAVEVSLVVNGWPRFGPDALQDRDIFISPSVAVLFRKRVAVSELVSVVTAADHVDRGSAAGDLIKRCELSGCQCGGDEAGAVGHEKAEFLGMRGSGGKQETVGSV